VRQEQEHEERRVRTEQKAAEKKARDEATAAEKERKRGEKEENKQTTPTKPRLFSTFLSRGATAGVAGGTAVAAVAETTGEGVGAAAKTAAASTPGTGAKASQDPEDVEIPRETFHDQVTMDPDQAAYAVAAASDDEDDDDTKPTQQENDARRLSNDDIGPRDTIATAPVTGIGQVQEEPTSPTSPTSPSKRDSRVKSWFKKLRTGSKAENDIGEKPILSTETEPEKPTEPLKEEEEDRLSADSVRDVALAGRSDNETDDLYGAGEKSKDGVSPVGIHATTEEPQTGGQRSRSVSPVSSALSEDPYVIAADVASSKYSAEHPSSKRNSGADQLSPIEDSDDEPRGRKGFRERFLKKVIPGRDKDKQKPAVTEAAPTSAAVAPIGERAEIEPAKSSDVEQHTTAANETSSEPFANPDSTILAETEPLHEKIQEPSTTSTEPANTTTTGATTPTLTHTVTNDGEDDFEEARDTFDEGALTARPKIIDVSKAQQLKPELVDVTSPTDASAKKGSASPVGSRHSGSGGGSRFTEEL
jgi:hypothetical protein